MHAEARTYADSGHLVALVGQKNHVEVIGTLGERPENTVVIESPEQARELKTDKPVAVITQTTLSLDDVAPIVDALEEYVGDLTAVAAAEAAHQRGNTSPRIPRIDAPLALAAGSRLELGAVTLEVVGELERCVIIDHDPVTGAKDHSLLRRIRPGALLAYGCMVVTEGELAVGDPARAVPVSWAGQSERRRRSTPWSATSCWSG